MKPTTGPWEIDDDSQHIDGIGTVRMYRVLAASGEVVAKRLRLTPKPRLKKHAARNHTNEREMSNAHHDEAPRYYDEMRERQAVLDAVAEALANALENGHDFAGWSNEAIADDMIECGGIDPDEFKRDDIVSAIKAQRS